MKAAVNEDCHCGVSRYTVLQVLEIGDDGLAHAIEEENLRLQDAAQEACDSPSHRY